MGTLSLHPVPCTHPSHPSLSSGASFGLLLQPFGCGYALSLWATCSWNGKGLSSNCFLLTLFDLCSAVQGCLVAQDEMPRDIMHSLASECHTTSPPPSLPGLPGTCPVELRYPKCIHVLENCRSVGYCLVILGYYSF